MINIDVVDINECSEETDGCDHICINTLGSYHCMCSDGFTLDSDNHTCHGLSIFKIDVDRICMIFSFVVMIGCILEYNANYHIFVDHDECLDETECEQVCHNSNGTFYCSCYNGYRLALNNRTCDGRFNYEDYYCYCYYH